MAIEDYKPKFKLKKGDPAPNFIAINQNGDKVELKKIKSKWTVLFFLSSRFHSNLYQGGV